MAISMARAFHNETLNSENDWILLKEKYSFNNFYKKIKKHNFQYLLQIMLVQSTSHNLYTS